MNEFIKYIIGRSRTVLLILFTLIIAGMVSFVKMAKEAEPDIVIPVIYVSIGYPGISPEDAERLLIKPMERELKNIEGIKTMTANASLGHASVVLEFEAGFNKEKALQDVRAQVDLAKSKLPRGAEEPTVNEVTIAQEEPVLVVGLAGDVPERSLLKIAKELKDVIETLPQILDVEISGDKEEILEVLIKPEMFETYNIRFEQLFTLIKQNNQLIAAGTIDNDIGRFALKIPGLIEHHNELMNMPVKAENGTVLKFQDLATIKKTYADPNGFARIGGKSAIALEIKKRPGENLIWTVAAVKAIVKECAKDFPETIKISFFKDKSDHIKNMLLDLENNLISAVLLVFLVVVIALGLRSSLLVGIAIPASFLTGIFVLYMMGFTINIIVLFSLILVSGMLVDGAIVVTEYADRKMAEGVNRRDAYILAGQRMWQPITSSTLTTLVAFMPLLFWPGIVGQFMKYLPITLIITLTASLFAAIIFIPTMGSLFGKPGAINAKALQNLKAAETGNFDQITGFTGWYIQILKRLLKRPFLVFMMAFTSLISVFFLYKNFGRGVEFFPEIEPDSANIEVKMRGNLSIYEIDSLLKEVENRVLDIPEFKTIYARSSLGGRGSEDSTGMIMLEFTDWKQRPKAKKILSDVRTRLEDIPGLIVNIRGEEGGPPVGKPINVELSSRYPELLVPEVEKVLKKFHSMPALISIEDTRSIPGIEWRLDVDREAAARFGANVEIAGNMIQFVSNGLKLDEYLPLDSDDAVDIRARYPMKDRTLSKILEIRIPTDYGNIPLSNFVKAEAAPKVSTIKRADGKRILNVVADLKDGFLADDQVRELKRWLKDEAKINPDVRASFKGEDEEQAESQKFLQIAFLVALALMAIILVTEFNSFYFTFLILTAVIFSTVGVFLGLLIVDRPFCIVMNGIGVICLAGIVVNNNIVLIDTYRHIRDSGVDAMNAILLTCAQRLRPVFLTTITTILGLLPMVCKVTLDFVNRSVEYDAPTTQWWSQLATSVAFGLAFATLLTLILTPAMIILGDKVGKRFSKH